MIWTLYLAEMIDIARLSNDKGCRLNMNTVLKTYQLINIDDLEKAINLLCNASTVYLFGVGGSAIIVNDIEQKLLRIGKRLFIIVIYIFK